jgi:hypothetical protein
LLSLAALLPSLVGAAPLVWTLSGVTLADGGSVTGSFTYDATTNTYSAINVTTSGGTSPGYTYTAYDPNALGGQKSYFLSAVPNPGLANFEGTPILVIEYGSLTNAGGTSSINVISSNSFEGTCLDATCISASIVRFVSAGQVTAPTPPPPTVPAVSNLGLCGLALLLAAVSSLFLRRTARAD